MHMNFGLAPGIAVLIFCCARYQNAIVKALSRPMLVLCGEASYSLYLLHVYVIENLSYGAPNATEFRIALGSAARFGIGLLACVGLSLVSWRIFEVPARRWLRNTLSIQERRSATVISGARSINTDVTALPSGGDVT